MNLDFCFGGKLNRELIPLFNEIAFDIRQEFVDLITDISRGNEDNIDWWVSGPSSRNPFISPLFHYCCCLVLLEKLGSERKRIDGVVTDSRAFLEIVKKASKETETFRHCSFTLKEEGFIAGLKAILSFLHAMLKSMAAWILCRILIESGTGGISKDIVLIDTFVMPGFTKNDRYYPGLLQHLSEKEKDRVFFVPTFYGISLLGIFNAISELKASKSNYLFKERFLNLRDIFFAWLWCLRAYRLKAKVRQTCFHGVNVAPLVKEELRSLKGGSGSATALMNYRFPMRLAMSGIEVRLVIDWFENQVIDKGWNAGFKKYLPKTDLVGYQGFLVTSNYLCMYPSKFEQECGLLPDVVCVTGKGLVNPIKEFCEKLRVDTAPTFRFQHLWQSRVYSPDPQYFTVLFALPIMIGEAANLLTTARDSLEKQSGDVRYWIKKHPATREAKVKEILDPWPSTFQMVQGSFDEIIEKADVLVSTASSVAMETLAKGIPVIIMGSQSGLTQNPIPNSISGDVWCLCYTTDEFLEAVEFYRQRTQEKIAKYAKIGEEIREEYFEPVTPESVRRFLGFSSVPQGN